MIAMKWNRGDAPRSWSAGRPALSRAARSVAVFAIMMSLLGGAAVVAQSTPAQEPQQTPPAQQPDQNTPDAGGPGGDNGVIALAEKEGSRAGAASSAEA